MDMEMKKKMTQTRLLQFYLENFFKFPVDIKNDLVYCQRALKTHIKVHQMVLDVFQIQEDADPDQKKRILTDIESQIYEINAEQHFLFSRLRNAVTEFQKVLNINNIPFNLNAINAFISKEVVDAVGNEDLKVEAVKVSVRNTEEKMLQKYFHVDRTSPPPPPPPEVLMVQEIPLNEPLYEIVDSDDDDDGRLVIVEQMSRKQELKQTIKLDSTNENVPLKNGGPSSNLSQMSLLKPMAQRLSGGASAAEDAPTQHQQMEVDLVEEKKIKEEQKTNLEVFASTSGFNNAAKQKQIPSAATVCASDCVNVDIKEEKYEEPREFFVSKNVTTSRNNLIMALKKARIDKIAAKAAASGTIQEARCAPVASKIQSPPKRLTPPKRTSTPKCVTPFTSPSPSPPPKMAVAAVVAAAAAAPVKKAETKTRATRAAAAKVAELSSSSEESLPGRVLSPLPPMPALPVEPKNDRTQPEHCGQNMFLSYFKLYTPETVVQMQQRRSKRKRRTVQNNERSDFHYGRIEYGNAPSVEDNKTKKQRKTFLLSPQVKRGLQQKKQRGKRSSADNKNDVVSTPSRSSSSSPNEKRGCNECLKGGGCIDQCAECKGFFHQLCHREEDSTTNVNDDNKPRSSAAKQTSPININKNILCPACKRAQKKFLNKEKQQYQSLHSTAQELENKMAKERSRRANLQKESKKYKIQMRNLFNIVNTIKSDQENDDSSE